MILYRPIGIKELELIKQSGMTKFPPRLPEQPIFYPVLNAEYARQIAIEWNTKSAPEYAGFVTEFEVDDSYISKYKIETVGSNLHKELWILAKELEDFNTHIIGKIKVIGSYYGENYTGFKTEDIILDSLAFIKRLKNGDIQVLKNEKWLKFLALTAERNINYERIESLEQMRDNYVLCYVEKTLIALGDFQLTKHQTYIIEETLKWAEVAKSGLKHQRNKWVKNGINLFVHNVGSAQIYLNEGGECNSDIKNIVYNLILTHGLIGQYIRGEVPLSDNKPLFQLIENSVISAEELKILLKALNYCVISAVDKSIWEEISKKVDVVIELVVSGGSDEQYDVKEKIKLLRCTSIKNGENFDDEFDKIFTDKGVTDKISKLFKHAELWYVEAALFDFSFEEFTKVFMIILQEVNLKKIKHISFEWLMKEIYYQYKEKKRVNIYKKRIIEKYLAEITIEDILQGRYKGNMHVAHKVLFHEDLDDTIFFTFHFSDAASKLIEFCMEAEKSDILYENAIILLFDLFSLRKDKYDRFYEEEYYLQTMNSSIDYKKILLDYIVGDNIVDIGPGGGALMNVIEERFPNKNVVGIDIAQNVLENLRRKKQIENRKWEVLYGDALYLGKYIEKGSVDTIIFCSILHELFSYIEFNDKKFNYKTLETAIKSALEVLPDKGRIIIRDGIMTEPESQKRIIKFLSEEGLEFLNRYVNDFIGREILYDVIGRNEVMMQVNDAMEFLYTYTWGEKSYVHEVNEQFGYFTPSAFKEFISSVLGREAKIVEFRHFLQEGYITALSQKIELFDENRNYVRLPDSTCIIVIEKIHDN